MNWDYIAGIVDGEGCIGLYIYDDQNSRGTHFTVTPLVQISNHSHTEFLAEIRRFLNDNGITMLGKTFPSNISIVISSWESIRCLVGFLEGKLILKQKELEILKSAVDLYYSLPKHGQGRQTQLAIRKFIELAIKCRGFKSNKGIKKDYHNFLKIIDSQPLIQRPRSI